MDIPRKEHPNPQFERSNWTNLNGEWEFEVDNCKKGIDCKFYNRDKLNSKITVPFCPESVLSGVQCNDFMNAVWYRRTFNLNEEQLLGHVILHFGAIDYESVVYVNKKEVGRHIGGYTSFSFDITDFVSEGVNELSVCAIDNVRDNLQASGKQSEYYYSHDCYYTRTTGIWQTVWLEYVPKDYIRQIWIYPDEKNNKVCIKADLSGKGLLTVCTSYEGKDTGSVSVDADGGIVRLEIPLTERHLWECGYGRLYDLTLYFGEDKVISYFGLRSVRIEDGKFLLNGKSIFQRLVLDQGYYSDGIYTAPSESDLIRDIEISMNVGFNGARLHEKVFEPRFLYHCDRMGYMVWGEYANWGFDHTVQEGLSIYLSEWREAVNRDFNHPSIICWCPFNETWDMNGRHQIDSLIETVYRETKLWDSTRPCVDTSGSYHVVTDIFDIHDYEQDINIMNDKYKKFENSKVESWESWRVGIQPYNGTPIHVSEYGGILWDADGGTESWGYGENPNTKEEFLERLCGLTKTLLNNGRIIGFCYTQLYDVEQERNGLYTYRREPKFAVEELYKIFSSKAKVEE